MNQWEKSEKALAEMFLSGSEGLRKLRFCLSIKAVFRTRGGGVSVYFFIFSRRRQAVCVSGVSRMSIYAPPARGV